MVKLLELDIPDFYIKEPLPKESIKILKKDKSKKEVVKRLFMIKSEVKPDYYFAETGPETGFFLTATVQPSFVLIGEARKQIEGEEIWVDLLKERPLYKIKVKMYIEKEYELFWEFEHLTKNKNEIYKTIINLKDKLENIIKETDIKTRQRRRVS
jgi:hypothetical protein